MSDSKRCHLSCHESAKQKYPGKQNKFHSISSTRSVTSALLNHIKSKKYIKVKQDRKQYICNACIAYAQDELQDDSSQSESEGGESSVEGDGDGTLDDTHFKSLLRDLKSESLSESQIKSISTALGKIISKSVKSQSKAERLDVTNVKSYNEEWKNVDFALRSLFQGIVNIETKDEEEILRRKTCLVKSVECIMKAKNSHFISNQALAENLVGYYFSGSKLSTTLFGKFGGGSSYRTIARLIPTLADRIVLFPTADCYVAFDNQQVLASHHRVSFVPQDRVSVVTSICTFSSVKKTTFQYHKLKNNILDPNELGDDDRKEILQKYKKFSEKANEQISRYRFGFLKDRLKKTATECSTVNGEIVDGLFSSSYESTENVGLDYNIVPQKGTDVHVRDSPILLQNPNSFKTVSTVLEHLTKESLKSDPKRKWIVVVCDGHPHTIVHSLVKNSFICQLCKETVVAKKGKIDHSCDIDVSLGHKTHNKNFVRKFPHIVLRAGNGHFELALTKVILNIYFPVYIKALARLCNFTTPTALEYIRQGHNHHKNWQLMRIMMESFVDELLFAYISQRKPSSPSEEGFQRWLNKSKNPNISLASTLVFSVLFPLFLYRSAIRQCNSELALMARDKIAALFFGFNNPRYRKICAIDTLFCVWLEGDSKEFLTQQSVRRFLGLFGEGHDFLLEWRNKLMKKWLRAMQQGLPTAKKWLQVSTALEILEQVKDDVFNRTRISKQGTTVRTVKLKTEIREFRKLIRTSGIFDSTVTEIKYLGESEVEPSAQLLTFMDTCEDNRKVFYKEFLYGKECKLKTLNADGSPLENNRNASQLKRDISLKLSYFPEPFNAEYSKKFRKLSNVAELLDFENLVDAELSEIRQVEYDRMFASEESDESDESGGE